MAEARRLEIVIHADLNGREPFSNWHGRLKDHQGHAVITSKINSLALGNFGNSKALGDGLYELRIHFGPGYRVYFGMRGSNLVILLAGGSKANQARDIVRAREYWQDHRRRFSPNSTQGQAP